MSAPQPPQSPPPGWWQASDGNWYSPEVHPSASQPPWAVPPSAGAVSVTGRGARPWWKRKRVLLPAAVAGLAAVGSLSDDGGVGQVQVTGRQGDDAALTTMTTPATTTTPVTAAIAATTTPPTMAPPPPPAPSTTVAAPTTTTPPPSPTTAAPPLSTAPPTTRQPPTTTTALAVLGTMAAARDGCDPNYAGACVPPYPPDVDCTELPDQDFQVVGRDVHGLDRGGTPGLACESD